MKYAQYCPECSKHGQKSELKHEESKMICVQCGKFAWVVEMMASKEN